MNILVKEHRICSIQIRRLAILFILVLASSFTLLATKVVLNPISQSDRLPSSTVYRVFQDSEGFIWLGTLDGLCRYDAYNMLVFRSDKSNPNLLTNNQITYLTEDDTRLFVGTRKGLNIIDKETYNIYPIPNEEVLSQEIRSVLVDSKGYVWIGTMSWLYRFNSDFTSWEKYDHELPITSVNSIYEDNNNIIWVALWGEGLHKYNSIDNNFERQSDIGTNNNPFKIYQDKSGDFWLTTWGDGLYRFYPNSSEEYIFESIEIPFKGISPDENYIFSISQDTKNNYLWLMSTSGVSALSIDQDEIVEVDVSSAFTDWNNIYSELLCDTDGNIWLATYGEGLLLMNTDTPLVENFSIPSIKQKTGFATNISAIYEDKDGDLWINQNRRGFGLYIPSENSVSFYHDYPTLKNIPGLDFINCIHEINSEEIWLCPESEPYIYIVSKEKGVPVLQKIYDLTLASKSPGNPRFVFEDSSNNVWIASTVSLYLKKDKTDEIVDTEVGIDNITGIVEDKEGCLWVSTNKNGLFRLSFNNKHLPDNIDVDRYVYGESTILSDNISTISTDKLGNIWLGSQEGHVFSYSLEKQEIIDYSNRFDMLEGAISNITVDNTGHLWISTNKSIVEYNPENHGVMVYRSGRESIATSFTKNSFYNNLDGKLFYGGNKGITLFTPSKNLSEEPHNLNVTATDLKINGESVFKNSTSYKLGVMSQDITLRHNDKNIEISFSSLNYTNSDKIQYAYKLQGVDDDWVYTDASRPFAYYNHLPKGRYKLLLKVTDVNGLWSSNVSSLSVYKKPAFYETWYAYTLYSILIFLALYGIYGWSMYRVRLNHKLRIAHIEKIKSEELNQAKLRYFTNVSHDFLTPLTIISCLIDDVETTMKDDVPQFSLMRTNINRLKRLQRQILDFRKMESGSVKLRVARADIVQFIKSICVNDFSPLMKKKNIRFSFETNYDDVLAYFDVDKIDKILFNLLSNAIKFTPKDGEITVDFDKINKDNFNFARISVADTGIGIAPEDLKKIFDPFYTTQAQPDEETNGIGLSLVKELTALHHGTIAVDSKVGKGSVFTFEIPIDRNSYKEGEFSSSNNVIVLDKDVDFSDNLAETSTIPDTVNEDINLLVVEDSEELLFLMKQLLSKSYNVLTASNGIEALSVIDENEINIIISDVMMPEMDGLELCRKLKSDIETSHIPIIMLTAKDSTEDRIDCYNAGADGYISKPFDLRLLEARINNFLAEKKNKQKEFKFELSFNSSTLGGSSLDKDFLDRTIKLIVENIQNPSFRPNILASKLYVSNSSLYRKVKEMTGQSPVEFIRNIRLKHACKLLIESDDSIADVAYASGFSNPKYFSTCFREEFNITPSEFRKKKKIGDPII